MIGPAELERINRRVQAVGAANCWTGTAGSLAADARRMVRELEALPPMPRIVGFCGAAGAGKDAAAAAVPGARRIAFADPLYAGLAAMLGVPESVLRDRATKENRLPVGVSPRRLLQTLGTEWGRQCVGPDTWVRLARQRWRAAAADGVPTIVVPDVRFSNEAAAIREAGGQVWLVWRPGVEPVEAHSSEAGLSLSAIDRLIVNSGSLEELRARVVDTFSRG